MADDRNYAPDYVSAETLAYRLDCSRSTIDAYVRSGLLPKPFMLGNLVRWDFAAVRDYIKGLSVGDARHEGEDDFLKAVRDGADKKG
jgi:excisionase family DNA binding protein